MRTSSLHTWDLNLVFFYTFRLYLLNSKTTSTKTNGRKKINQIRTHAWIGNPKFWYDLIRPSHPAVTTTRPHVSVPFWQATFRNFNWDLDNERWLGVPGESFSSGHVAFPLVPCESSCMEMRSWRSVAWAPFQGTAREVWSDMKCSEDFMSFPWCKLLVTWDAEFNK